MNKPFAAAAEQNKQVIFDAISSYLKGDVLEIGSGSGQHAVYFAGLLPAIRWQPSELASNLPGIEDWIQDSGLPNIAAPIPLDVMSDWPQREFDTVYSANCFHIMSEAAVAACLRGIGRCLKPGGACAVYGPFNYNGSTLR